MATWALLPLASGRSHSSAAGGQSRVCGDRQFHTLVAQTYPPPLEGRPGSTGCYPATPMPQANTDWPPSREHWSSGPAPIFSSATSMQGDGEVRLTVNPTSTLKVPRRYHQTFLVGAEPRARGGTDAAEQTHSYLFRCQSIRIHHR